jgi:hypothetical protein
LSSDLSDSAARITPWVEAGGAQPR